LDKINSKIFCKYVKFHKDLSKEDKCPLDLVRIMKTKFKINAKGNTQRGNWVG
jgi:hypothetical protein